MHAGEKTEKAHGDEDTAGSSAGEEGYDEAVSSDGEDKNKSVVEISHEDKGVSHAFRSVKEELLINSIAGLAEALRRLLLRYVDIDIDKPLKELPLEIQRLFQRACLYDLNKNLKKLFSDDAPTDILGKGRAGFDERKDKRAKYKLLEFFSRIRLILAVLRFGSSVVAVGPTWDPTTMLITSRAVRRAKTRCERSEEGQGFLSLFLPLASGPVYLSTVDERILPFFAAFPKGRESPGEFLNDEKHFYLVFVRRRSAAELRLAEKRPEPGSAHPRRSPMPRDATRPAFYNGNNLLVAVVEKNSESSTGYYLRLMNSNSERDITYEVEYRSDEGFVCSKKHGHGFFVLPYGLKVDADLALKAQAQRGQEKRERELMGQEEQRVLEEQEERERELREQEEHERELREAEAKTRGSELPEEDASDQRGEEVGSGAAQRPALPNFERLVTFREAPSFDDILSAAAAEPAQQQQPEVAVEQGQSWLQCCSLFFQKCCCCFCGPRADEEDEKERLLGPSSGLPK